VLLFCLSVVADTTPADSSYTEAVSLLHRLPNRGSTAQKSSITRLAAEAITGFFISRVPNAPDNGNSLGPTLAAAVSSLQTAADDRHPDAIYMLADMNFFGNFSHPRNYSEAFRRYKQLADLNGNSSAQHMIGFLYATGFGGAVERDQAKANLYYTFAAEAGNTRSEMALAYRYNYGISTPRNCEKAVFFLRRVAEKAIAHIRTGPPGGHQLVKESYRIADEEGGLYGEGASVISAGVNAKRGGPQSDQHAAVDDVLEYLDLISRKGDLKATFSLGKLHYDGSRGMKRDFRLAKQYFLEVARQYWSKGGKIRPDVPAGTERLASKAAGYLGRMFLRAEGIEQSFEIANTWFKRGISNGDAISQYSLGLMYLNGLGVKKDPKRAAELFSAAADQDLAPAQVRLGVLFLDSGDIQTALRYFDLAARNGQVEALYYLGEHLSRGIGREASCPMASHYFKMVAEKAEAIVSSFIEANEAYEAGDTDLALIDYMLAAEQGFEIAQNNVAHVLDKARPRRLALPPPVKSLFSKHGLSSSFKSLLSDPSLALLYFSRSARQSNIDALIKLGDYYYNGYGTPSNLPDTERAAACYQAAAESLQSAQAFWNLGWMHENGIGGMEQDFHLAKRYYDQAFETNAEAYLPVKLALMKVRARSWWNEWTKGGVKSIVDEPGRLLSRSYKYRSRSLMVITSEPRKRFSLQDWIANYLEADGYYDDEPEDWEHDGQSGGMPVEDIYGEEVYEDGLLESLVICVLALVFAVLVIYRRRRQEERERARQREELARQNGQGAGAGGQGNANEDRGLFPAQGQGEFMDWAVGGVGH
jgi:SEL1 protein